MEDRDMLEDLRQPYRTPSERAADRKERAQSGLSNTQADRPEDAPELVVHITPWVVQQQDDPRKYCVVRSPSRSGAKIFANNILGLIGPFFTWLADEAYLAQHNVKVHEPDFETVQQFAARMEQEKKK